MTIIDLTAALIDAFPKIPVFYNHIIVEEGAETPPAYIVTNSEQTNPFHADNKTYYAFVSNTVKLYVGNLSEKFLSMLDKFFKKNGIAYTKDVNFDEFAYLYEIAYTVSLDEVEDEENGNDQP